MSDGPWSLIAALAGLALWIGLSLDRRRRWPAGMSLPQGTEEVDPAVNLSVVVPARNEAELLPRTLPSLLDQAWPGFELVVVDDQSSDGTAAVVSSLAAGQPLHLRRVREHPADWTGKLNALEVGVTDALERRPEVEWLLLSDADIRHRLGSLKALLKTAEEGNYDLVSVMARLHAESFWERLIIPPFTFFFNLLYPFSEVARPTSRVAAAAGGCVLLRRQALERAGGLRAVRDAVIDDVALAKAIKGAGGRLWLGLDSGIVSVRPYRGLGGLWEMVARSAFVQLGHRWLLLAGCLVGLGVLVVAPPFLALRAGAAILGTEGQAAISTLATLGASLLAWALQGLALRPWVRHHRVPWPFAATLPLASGLYGLMTLSSALDYARGRGSRWKGRQYPHRRTASSQR